MNYKQKTIFRKILINNIAVDLKESVPNFKQVIV